MSLLFTEYDEEVAKRVYAEEYAEDRIEEVAKKMVAKGFDIADILETTNISVERLQKLRN